MTHTLIQIQCYLFIKKINLRLVSSSYFFYGEFLHGIYFYSTIIFIHSHILRLQMGSTTFNNVSTMICMTLHATSVCDTDGCKHEAMRSEQSCTSKVWLTFSRSENTQVTGFTMLIFPIACTFRTNNEPHGLLKWWNSIIDILIATASIF